jgi:hypothetical protein
MKRRGTEAMPKTKPKSSRPARKPMEPAADLRQALSKRTKTELVAVLLELAHADNAIHRRLTARFDVALAPDQLADATRLAIADATDFDERQVNRNFDYDYEAYSEVQRNLSGLITAGKLRLAMQLAMELMKEGSYQVEMSDEGLMTADIESCLSVVIEALTKCDLPAKEVIAWCSAMLAADRGGFISLEPLESLRNQLQARS